MGGAYHCTVTWAGTSQHWCHRLETSAKKANFLYSCALMFVIPMYNHQTTFCFVLISSDILWNCFQILWFQLLKSTPEIYATLGPHSPGSHTCDGSLAFNGENQLSPGYIAVTPIPWRSNNVYNRICKHFCKKEKKIGKNAEWHHAFGSKKKDGESCCSWTLWP